MSGTFRRTTPRRGQTLAGVLLGITVLVLAAGCAHSPHYGVRDVDHLVGDEYTVVPHLYVPEVRSPNACGMQALAAVLHFHDPAEDIEELLAYEPWDPRGATSIEILQQARRRGYEAQLHQGTWDLIATHLEAGAPVLVLYDASVEERLLTMARQGRPAAIPLNSRIPRGEEENLHWAAVGGISPDGNSLAIAIPRNRFFLMDRESFLERWEASANCMIIVKPPPS